MKQANAAELGVGISTVQYLTREFYSDGAVCSK